MKLMMNISDVKRDLQFSRPEAEKIYAIADGVEDDLLKDKRIFTGKVRTSTILSVIQYSLPDAERILKMTAVVETDGQM